jgi:voltage-gated potassium channel
MNKTSEWNERRKRIFTIIEVGNMDNFISRGYDIISTMIIIINLVVSVMMTFDEIEAEYSQFLLMIEFITVAFFGIDYVLRIWTAKFLYPRLKQTKAIRKYMLSFTGIVDLFSFLPYFLPMFFPSGVVAFRMFRIIRIFRLFRINAYYDSLNVITEVIANKKQQLLSSVFIILVLMLASSLCMYSLEHEAQPEVFRNAFSGIWWSVSTLLTVGYGDIYPITFLGKIFGIFISFLGVGMVAIPTGIISAGFVDQYSKFKRISEYANEEEIHFIKMMIRENDVWANKMIKELGLPYGVIVALIQRGESIVVPRGDVALMPGDTIVLGAPSYEREEEEQIELKEIILKEQNPWRGQKIRNIDISRRSVIVMVKRNGKLLIPNGDLELKVNDKVILYTQSHLIDANKIQI